MKLRDLERHLVKHGARRVGEGAGHTKWRGPAGAPSVVPRHREIDLGLVRKICRDLGVDTPTGSRWEQRTGGRRSVAGLRRLQRTRQELHLGLF